jgi:arylsulfatase A-like enzyme
VAYESSPEPDIGHEYAIQLAGDESVTIRNKPDIIFVVLDTCRADIFYELIRNDELPGVGQIVSNATMYENAVSPAPWTVPAHGSLFSGLYPTDHGTNGDDPYFDPPTTPLAKRLQSSGYETVGLSANPWISPSFDFAAGFDRFKTADDLFSGGVDLTDIVKLDSRSEQILSLFQNASLADLPKTTLNIIYRKFFSKRKDSGANHLTNTALKYLSSRSMDRPLFLFINYMEPHLRYDPPDRFVTEELPDDVSIETAKGISQDPWAYVSGSVDIAEKDFDILKSLYRAEIKYLDTQIRRLYDRLSREGSLEDSAIILLGDHGENIGDHGLMDHQYSLFETLLHVPLIIRFPSMFDKGRSNQLVETHSLYETVIDMAGIDHTEKCTATSLFQSSGADYAIAEYTTPQPSVRTLDKEYGPLDESVWIYDRSLRSIRSEEWKYIEGTDGFTALYDLCSDPNEVDPIENEEVENELSELLNDRRGSLTTAFSDSRAIDETRTKQLRDLGYL